MSMQTVYRDYGASHYPQETPAFIRNDEEVQVRNQVYRATHMGDGPKNRLPYMNRSFISFSYGTRINENSEEVRVNIEDFDLIATIENNRWERDGYTAFNDLTTSYDNLDGQHYWGTHYNSHTITFNLSTDGINQKKLDEFLQWFRPGIYRELVLSEHPNRAQLARVSEPPHLSLLPFEGQAIIKINGEDHAVVTTLFKGEITLKLTMDDPHWYALDNVLGIKKPSVDDETGQTHMRYVDWWIDANGNEVEIFASQDALKILYEDGLPLGSMIENNMLLGNGAFANVENHEEMLVWSKPESEIQIINGYITEEYGVGARIYGTITSDEFAERSREVIATENLSLIETQSGEEIWTDLPEDFIPDWHEYRPGKYLGKIAGAIIDVDGNGITILDPYSNGYFFYAGNAPSPTILSFTIYPIFNTFGYFYAINNTFINPLEPNSTITIESTKQQKLTFTTPNLITSYNTAVKILQDGIMAQKQFQEMRDEIVEKVRHPAVRGWASALLSEEDNQNTIDYQVIAAKMQSFFQDDQGNFTPMTFSFNSKTGEAIGEFNYRNPNQSMSLYDILYADNAQNKWLTVTSYDPNLTDQERYENLVTWGWAQYCINSNNELIDPIENPAVSYEDAVDAFTEYVNRCRDNGISVPTIFTANASVLSLSTMIDATEDVGDMLTSNNLFITERNYPNELGKIVHWTSYPLVSRTYSHRITHDLPVSLRNLQLIYKNMYL